MFDPEPDYEAMMEAKYDFDGDDADHAAAYSEDAFEKGWDQ